MTTTAIESLNRYRSSEPWNMDKCDRGAWVRYDEAAQALVAAATEAGSLRSTDELRRLESRSLNENAAKSDSPRAKIADLRRVVWGVVHNARVPGRPRWAAVGDATGVGSTMARNLCREFECDPDEVEPGHVDDPGAGE